jgi:hypothetical protein
MFCSDALDTALSPGALDLVQVLIATIYPPR